MGPAGKEYVYKDELRAVRLAAKKRAKESGEREAAEWLKAEEAKFNLRYERELMNPREALSLGSISEIVMPTDLRSTLGKSLQFLLRRYQPGPMQGVQREFF
jgi:acetyl-CoA carboxylase carboxyltransferase component